MVNRILYDLQECYKGYAIEIGETRPESWPNTYWCRIRSCGWYYDMTSTYVTKELALECAKDRIDKWKEADEKDDQ